MHQYLIALGANLGDREYYIEQAIEAIRTSCGPILQRAPLYETVAMGAAVHPFLNTALICQTAIEPAALLTILLAIEERFGRIREERWGNRTLDCDIILWRRSPGLESQIVASETLTIPHPEAAHRAFVLEPAAAIAGSWEHPILGCTVQQLWQRLEQSGS